MNVELRDVTKKLGSADVLDDVTLTIDTSEGVLLTGENGAGKTTLLQLIVGLQLPTAGEVLVDGRDPSDVAVRSQLAYVADEPVLYTDITAEEQLFYVAHLHDDDESSADARVERAIAAFGLEERRQQPPPAMSRGWRQRVGLCLAWVKPFELVVIDEPVSGLDERGAEQLRKALRGLRAEGKGFVVASHSPAFFDGIAGRHVEVADGKLRSAAP